MKSNFRLFFPSLLKVNYKPNVCKFSSNVDEIKIPLKIQRSPTDILKALSRTVGVDHTAAHFKFHDDPYLMPYSNPSKRSYALSQEAGRKAARWIRQQHGDLFQHKVAEPAIEAFVPKLEYNDESNVSEETILSLIHMKQVSDAMTVYKILNKREVAISVQTKEKLLEMVCFYNCQDPLSDEWVEENWFRQGNQTTFTATRQGKNTWKNGGFAEKLFEEISQQEDCDKSKVHSALIAGMLAHGQIDGGWKMFEEAKQKGLELSVEIYNALIRKGTFLRESHDMVWRLVLDLLAEMHTTKIRPNVHTLNSVLHTLEMCSSNSQTRQNALSAISEFKTLGIKPSLASFAHLIRIFQRDNAKLGGVVRNIIENLETESDLMSAKTADDSKFFMTAMEIINNKLSDKGLALRLDNLLHNASNYSLVGSSFNESVYYRNYFKLMMNTEEIDEFMNFYYKFVPNIYVPELGVMMELLNNVETQMGWKHLPKMWGDLILFDQVRTDLVAKLLALMAQAAVDDAALAPQMAETGWKVWEKVQTVNVRNFELSADILGNLLKIFVYGENLAKAHIIMDKIDRTQDSVTGEVPLDCLDKYITACLEAKNIDGALRCAKYCESRGMLETEALLKKIENSGHKLDTHQERVLNDLLKKY